MRKYCQKSQVLMEFFQFRQVLPKSGKDFLDLESHPLFIIVTIFFAIEGAVVHFPPKTHINFLF